MSNNNGIDKITEILEKHGFIENGVTQTQTYRTTSIGYPGGSVVITGSRRRFIRGNWIVTIGKRTVCFSLKPDNPETIPGRGRLIGKNVMTFRDWKQNNFPTKDIEGIKVFLNENL